MAVNWTKARNEYINGNISQRAIAEKYGVTPRTVFGKAKEEKWTELRAEQQKKISARLQQKAVEKIADKEADRMVRISDINDQILTSIEQSMKEINLAVLKGKKQKRKSKIDSDGGTSEIFEVEENVSTALSVIDVRRLRDIASALRDIAEISNMTKGYTNTPEAEESDIVKALREAYKERNNATE